ncbi:MAG: tRNA dihydrouridine synthase DusB [Myxococcales bacterium]|nr:tRNA dihydrouridine synthase DusB [Myxococcales bacterium]
MRHNPVKEPLLAVQIYGGEPDVMARAAERVVERGAKIVDINMGCPVKKVTRNLAGSALMTVPDRAAEVVLQIIERIDPVPVTVKMRSGWSDDHKNARELALRLRDAGAAAIAIHPRTRAQGYEGSADWSVIAEVKAALPDLPIIANGDIFSADDADEIVRTTGCDAIMIGRAALGNPWIFRDLVERWRAQPAPLPPIARERVETILRHFHETLEHVGDPLRGVRKFRQHLIWYSRGSPDGSKFRERVVLFEEPRAVEDAVETYFGGLESMDPREQPIYDSRSALG